MDYFELKGHNIEQINHFLLEKMENLLFLVQNEKRLCSSYSSQVVAEFGFKGDKEAVYKQLLDLFEYRKENPYTEMDIPDLQLQHERWLDHISEEKKYPEQAEYKKMMDDNILNPSPEKWALLDSYLQKWQKSKITMHEKKECLCYTNN